MRVIAGVARSMPLKTVEGLETRPTTDRIKETLFNMLQSQLSGCLFLDLYSGSGAIGIEALSRGAKEAIFVEHSKPCTAIIQENLKFTKLEEKATVLQQDVLSAISRLSGKYVFDIVFMDPPYDNDLERDVLCSLKQNGLIDEFTTIIVEESLHADLSYTESIGFDVYKTKKYKTNKHLFIRMQTSAE